MWLCGYIKPFWSILTLGGLEGVLTLIDDFCFIGGQTLLNSACRGIFQKVEEYFIGSKSHYKHYDGVGVFGSWLPGIQS